MNMEKEYHNKRVIFYLKNSGGVCICTEPISHLEWFIREGILSSEEEDPNFDNIIRGNVRDNKITFYRGKNFSRIDRVDSYFKIKAKHVLRKLYLEFGDKNILDSSFDVYNGVVVGEVGKVWELDQYCGEVSLRVTEPAQEDNNTRGCTNLFKQQKHTNNSSELNISIRVCTLQEFEHALFKTMNTLLFFNMRWLFDDTPVLPESEEYYTNGNSYWFNVHCDESECSCYFSRSPMNYNEKNFGEGMLELESFLRKVTEHKKYPILMEVIRNKEDLNNFSNLVLDKFDIIELEDTIANIKESLKYKEEFDIHKGVYSKSRAVLVGMYKSEYEGKYVLKIYSGSMLDDIIF